MSPTTVWSAHERWKGRNMRDDGLLTTREREDMRSQYQHRGAGMARISSTNPSCCLLGCLGETVFQESSQMLGRCTARRQTERKVCLHTCRIACTLPWRTFSQLLNPVVSLLMPILNGACFTACNFPAFNDLFAI